MRRKRLPFTNAELKKLATDWIASFGNLSELITIRHVLQEAVAEMRDLREQLADRLESIAIMLGGPKR